jgi:uncharacterized protein (UPF0262 family)
MVRHVRIEDALWDGASRPRRDDWRVAIADLVDAGIGQDGDDVLHVGLAGREVVLATFDAAGAPTGVVEVSHERLRPHVEEYLAVIHRLQHHERGEASAQVHALDMAKKVVHDNAARTLATALSSSGFGGDHESYRRLFSLLLSVLVDVTKLPGARTHRHDRSEKP